MLGTLLLYFGWDLLFLTGKFQLLIYSSLMIALMLLTHFGLAPRSPAWFTASWTKVGVMALLVLELFTYLIGVFAISLALIPWFMLANRVLLERAWRFAFFPQRNRLWRQ